MLTTVVVTAMMRVGDQWLCCTPMDQGATAEQLQAQHEAAREQFLDEHPGLFNALMQAPQNDVLYDLLCSFHDYGKLTPAQVALALLLGNEKHVDAPIGRVTIRGTVVSVKARKNDESALVMTVLVVTPDGSWLAWGSVPAKLRGNGTLVEVLDALRCAEVEFRATVAHGEHREAFWGYYRNPRAASIVQVQPDAASS